ncbi:amidohydrolase family protein [Paenibacillus sp. N1-5-1-14]|uniref:amidohydrolase family protein n=1 Tax=Paenibacillus radicibacter TaxID=2972488 RepID=UPI00215969D8|nr:amidohydrolase family protein [Paenibacillus radicibacter]MCR8644495.1 amidohydrolase family protein [Paenibacillus radicibacter]
MSTNRKIITNGYIITMDDNLGDLPNGAVLIEGNKIVAVAESAEDFTGIEAEVIDAEGGIILPGIVDSHRHTWMSLLRAISADMSLPEFLVNTFYRIGSVVTAEDMGAATLVGSLEAIDSGVTTIMDCCDCVNTPDHGIAAVESLRQTGIRGVYAYGMQHYDFQPRAFHEHSERLRDAERLLKDQFSSDSLVKMGILMSDYGTLPFEHSAAEFNKGADMGVLMCSHTGAATSSLLLKGLREFKDHNLIRPNHLHIHCNGFTDPEWEIVKETGGKVSISPETEMQMGMGHPPFRKSLEHGIMPSFSTDIVCVGSGDLFSQMRLGLQFQRTIDNDKVHANGTMPMTIDLSVRDALRWATQGGAEALGLGDEIGSLTPGKKADVIIVSAKRSFVPSSYPAGTVVLQTTAADVDTVIIDGEIKKRHGELVGQDLFLVRARATQALERMRKAAEKLPLADAAGIKQWWTIGERMATKSFGEAYKTGLMV